MDRLVKLEYSARQLSLAVVPSLRDQDLTVVVNDDGGNANRVLR
jgi:hypothetical protein